MKELEFFEFLSFNKMEKSEKKIVKQVLRGSGKRETSNSKNDGKSNYEKKFLTFTRAFEVLQFLKTKCSHFSTHYMM